MIEIEDIWFTYPSGVQALKGISLTIKDGEFLAVMGQNGAGKTTLVKHFNGLLKPSKGRVIIDGTETTKTSVASLAKNVGFVFQNPDNQLFSESVEEEIAFGLRNFGFEKSVVEKRVEWALNLLALTQYRTTSPFMLSGGERKRVALASVLAWDPKILVLDEPTIGQDYQQKEKLLQFIMQMKSQQRTIVIVTHDVEFVAESNPKVVLMQNGKVTSDGEARDVLTDVEGLAKASIVPPQMSQLFLGLADLGFSRKVIDVYEAEKVLCDAFGKKN